MGEGCEKHQLMCLGTQVTKALNSKFIIIANAAIFPSGAADHSSGADHFPLAVDHSDTVRTDLICHPLQLGLEVAYCTLHYDSS